jgi:hypothetical protein
MKTLALIMLLALLSASAFGQVAHQVTLTWKQSAGILTSGNLGWFPLSGGITGNCVYRALSSVGPYSRLFCSSSPSITYTDTTVQAGQTYYYAISAVAGSAESGISDPVQAVIPTP